MTATSRFNAYQALLLYSISPQKATLFLVFSRPAHENFHDFFICFLVILHKEKIGYILLISVRYNVFNKEKEGYAMNDQTKKVCSSALLLCLAFVLLGVLFRTVALLSFYIPTLGHFETGFFSGTFLPLLFILAFVVFACFGFAFRETLSGRLCKNTLPSLFASAIAAIVSAAWTVFFFIDFLSKEELSPLLTVLSLLLCILGVLTVAFFIFSALGSENHTASVLTGIGAAFFCIAQAFYAYFDSSLTLNSPIKLFEIVTFLVLILFFLGECRYRFGMIRDSLFFPVCMMAAVLSAASSFPHLIYTAAEGMPLLTGTMHDFLMLGFFLFTLTRLISPLTASIATAAASGTDNTFSAFDATAETLAPAEPAQETFDFGDTAEKEGAPQEEAYSEDTESEWPIEEQIEQATLDFDLPQKKEDTP